MRLHVVLCAVLLAAALLAGGVLIATAQISPDIIEPAILRTVQLGLLVKVGEGNFKVVGGCSGSFVSASGHILTASHCVRATEDKPNIGIRKGELFNPQGLAIVAVNRAEEARPTPLFVAKYVADVPELDLGIIQVAAVLGNGGTAQALPQDLRLPFIPVGNSDAVRHGDPIALIGFPGVGGDTVTVNQGTVAGFIADEQNRKVQLKIDAAGGPGSSGGPIINARGEQVAVLSGARLDPGAIARSVRATLTNRMPAPWAQAIKGGGTPIAGTGQGTQPPAAGAVFAGRVVDAASRAGIQGANIFVLRPGVSASEATRSDVLAGAVTDSNGVYQTSPAVRKGATYTVVILAQGYAPLSGRIEVTANDPDVVRLEPAPLQR